jgi:hypothetical protein
MDASTASAYIAAVSAAVSAISAWNARKSAQASLAAVRETREQRAIDNSRSSLTELGSVYDNVAILIESLARDLTRDPAAVTRHRDALRRSILVAGITTPAIQKLIDATGPLQSSDVQQIREDLMSQSVSLRNSAERQVLHSGTDGNFGTGSGR